MFIYIYMFIYMFNNYPIEGQHLVSMYLYYWYFLMLSFKLFILMEMY